MKKIYENIFIYGTIVSYILYFIILFNVYDRDDINLQSHLDNLKFFLKIFVCTFLIIRFNPLTKQSFTEFDRNIVFSSAFFLLSTTTITDFVIYRDYISYYLKSIYNYII
jgi:hypothetical protein